MWTFSHSVFGQLPHQPRAPWDRSSLWICWTLREWKCPQRHRSAGKRFVISCIMVATDFLFKQMDHPGPQHHIACLQWSPDKKVSPVQHRWRKHKMNPSGSGFSKYLMVAPGPSVDYHSCPSWGRNDNFDPDSTGNRAVILHRYVTFVHHAVKNISKPHKVSMMSLISIRRLTANLQRDRCTFQSPAWTIRKYVIAVFCLFVHLDSKYDSMIESRSRIGLMLEWNARIIFHFQIH